MSDLGYSSLGTVNIAVIYLAFACSSAAASQIIMSLGVRCTLTLSSFTYVIWIFSFVLPAYKYERKQAGEIHEEGIFSDAAIKIITIGAAFLTGLGAGTLWVSQAYYVSECATEHNKGRYNGLFFSIFQVASMASGALAGAMIDNLPKTIFYLIMGSIAFTATLWFICVQQPINVKSSGATQDTVEVEL